jgi:hypothetical protein
MRKPGSPVETPCRVALENCEVLNLGCGRKYVTGAVNVDVRAETNPDLLQDLNLVPWLFPDDHFKEVLAYDVIEHLDDTIRAMEEIHRICCNEAVVRITLPHFSCANAYTDPTHRHYFGRFSFNYVSGEGDFAFYSSAKFRCRSSGIIFYPTLINKIVWRLANRYPAAYERRWAWMFPAWFLYFELEVLKDVNLPVGQA